MSASNPASKTAAQASAVASGSKLRGSQGSAAKASVRASKSAAASKAPASKSAKASKSVRPSASKSGSKVSQAISQVLSEVPEGNFGLIVVGGVVLAGLVVLGVLYAMNKLPGQSEQPVTSEPKKQQIDELNANIQKETEKQLQKADEAKALNAQAAVATGGDQAKLLEQAKKAEAEGAVAAANVERMVAQLAALMNDLVDKKVTAGVDAVKAQGGKIFNTKNEEVQAKDVGSKWAWWTKKASSEQMTKNLEFRTFINTNEYKEMYIDHLGQIATSVEKSMLEVEKLYLEIVDLEKLEKGVKLSKVQVSQQFVDIITGQTKIDDIIKEDTEDAVEKVQLVPGLITIDILKKNGVIAKTQMIYTLAQGIEMMWKAFGNLVVEGGLARFGYLGQEYKQSSGFKKIIKLGVEAKALLETNIFATSTYVRGRGRYFAYPYLKPIYTDADLAKADGDATKIEGKMRPDAATLTSVSTQFKTQQLNLFPSVDLSKKNTYSNVGYVTDLFPEAIGLTKGAEYKYTPLGKEEKTGKAIGFYDTPTNNFWLISDLIGGFRNGQIREVTQGDEAFISKFNTQVGDLRKEAGEPPKDGVDAQEGGH